MFNIFAELDSYWSKNRRLDAYLEKRGITLEQYKQELKEQAEKAHSEYLKKHGITEGKYLKQQKRRQAWEKIKGVFKGICCLLVIPAFVIVVSEFINAADNSELLQIVLASLFGLTIMAVIYVPVFIVVFKIVRQSNIKKKWCRVAIGLFFSVMISAIIIFLLMQCSKGFYYEPGKLRPDRF